MTVLLPSPEPQRVVLRPADERARINVRIEMLHNFRKPLRLLRVVDAVADRRFLAAGAYIVALQRQRSNQVSPADLLDAEGLAALLKAVDAFLAAPPEKQAAWTTR